MSLIDLPEKTIQATQAPHRTDFGQISVIPIETTHDCSIKLLSFQFDDPYQASFKTLERQLSTYLSRGWLILNISAAMAKDSLDGRQWGTGMVVLKQLQHSELWRREPEQIYQLKIIPIVSLDPYADTLDQGEIWLDHYLTQGWRTLDVITLAGGDEIPLQRWAMSLIFLGHYGNSADMPPAIEWCSAHLDGEQCQHNSDCLWCNY